MPAILQKVKQKAQLFSLPDIYLRLRDLLAEPDYTLTEVALLVGSDPAMATRFLRVVNSPLNRRINTIETVGHAVSLLGSRQVHDIVLSTSIAEAFEGIVTDVMNMRQFWQRSVYCAVTAQQLGSESGETDGERLFVMGLLHDIGHLFMYLAIPDLSQKAILAARESDRPLYQVERETLGFDYAQVGSEMMQKWDLPNSLQATTRFHPEAIVESPYAKEIGLLHLSALLVQSDQEGGDFACGSYSVNNLAWETTGLSYRQCLDVQQSAKQQFEDVANSLFH